MEDIRCQVHGAAFDVAMRKKAFRWKGKEQESWLALAETEQIGRAHV